MKLFRGVKTLNGEYHVTLDNEGYHTIMPIAPSQAIADHSEHFAWGYNGSGPAQLALSILYEVTDDPILSREYYQFLKHDHVARWGDTFEISEDEVLNWLRAVGAEVDTQRQNFINETDSP